MVKKNNNNPLPLQIYIPTEYLLGVAASVVLSVPGSASIAGVAPSIMGRSFPLSGVSCTNFLPLLLRALAMVECSVGKFASWWNTFLFLMIVYTRLLLPKIQIDIWMCSWDGWFFFLFQKKHFSFFCPSVPRHVHVTKAVYSSIVTHSYLNLSIEFVCKTTFIYLEIWETIFI